MNLIESLEARRRGGVIKHTHFFDIYESHFMSSKDCELKILEIGVYNGGSLYMWRNYFPNSTIVGIDIDEYCKQWESKDDKIYVELGDQCDEKFLNRVNEKYGPFDIIIDDGGHENHQINFTFNVLWPLLNDGGIYVVEDVAHAYWPDYDCDRDKSTLGNPTNIIHSNNLEMTSMDFLKSLADKLNVWAYKNNPEAKSMQKIGKYDCVEKSLYSIHFYDNIVFMQKLEREKEDSYGVVKWFANK